MAESEIIKHDDFAEKGFTLPAKKETEDFYKSLIAIEETLPKIAKGLQSAFGGKTITSIKELRELEKAEKDLDAIEQIQLKTKKAKIEIEKQQQKVLQEQQKTAQQKIKTEKEELALKQKLEAETKKAIKLKQDESNEYKKQSAILNDLRNKYKDLAAQNKGNTDEAKKLLQSITTLDKKLKEIDSTVGQHQRNVGNYTGALKGTEKALMAIERLTGINTSLLRDFIASTKVATVGQQLFSVVVGNSVGAMKALRIALAATGIGAVIFLIYELVNSFDIFGTKSKEAKAATEEFNKEMRESDSVISGLKIKYELLTGAITENEAAIKTLALEHKETLDEINRQTEKQLNKERAWWQIFLNIGKLSREESLEIQRKANEKRKKEEEKLNAELANLKIENSKKDADLARKFLDDYVKKDTQDKADAVKRLKDYYSAMEAEQERHKKLRESSQKQMLEHEREEQQAEFDEKFGNEAEQLLLDKSQDESEEARKDKLRRQEWDAEKQLIEDKENLRKQDFENTMKNLDLLSNEFEKALQKRSDIQEKSDQRKIDMRTRNIETQRQLAADGQKNILAEEEARLVKAEQKKIDNERKAARQKEAMELAELFLKLSVTYAEKGDGSPEVKALIHTLAAKAIAKGISGSFEEGTENLGERKGNGVDGKGGMLIVAHPNERIVTAEQNKKIGDVSNEQLADMAYNFKNLYLPQFNSQNVSSTQKSFNYHDNKLASVFQSEISELRNEIKNKPVQSVSLDGLSEWTEEISIGRKKTITHHKRERLW